MPTTALPLATLFYLCSHHMASEDILLDLCTPQKTISCVEKKSEARNQKRIPPAYVFGKTAAQSVEDAVAQGFVKNENPQKPGTPLLTCLEVGDCVAVPRNDKTLSFGVVTEVISPTVVCVACDTNSRADGDLAIKTLPTSQLLLNPYWLNNTFKDGSTLAHYNQLVRPSAPVPSENKE